MNNTWSRHKAIRDAIHEQLPDYEIRFGDKFFEEVAQDVYEAVDEDVILTARYEGSEWRVSAKHT